MEKRAQIGTNGKKNVKVLTEGDEMLNWRLITHPMGHWLLLISELRIWPINQ